VKLLAAAILAAALVAAPAAQARPHAKHHSKKTASFRKAKAKAGTDTLRTLKVGERVFIPTPSQPDGTPLVIICTLLYESPSLQAYGNCTRP
jgi:hypothetical protein